MSDGMSELNGSVKKACKQPVFQTRDRHRGRIERPSARWLTLRQTLRGKCPPDRSLDAARRAGYLGAPALSGHRHNYRQRCADLWCRYRRPSICRDSWLIRITARSREDGTSRAKPRFTGHAGGCPRNAARLWHGVLSDIYRLRDQ